MSEADSPNDQSVSPAPVESVELSTATDTATDSVTSEVSDQDGDGWQTLNFPGAMSVDALSHGSIESPGHIESLGQIPGHITVGSGETVGFGEAATQGVIRYSGAEIDQTAASFTLSKTSDQVETRLNDAALRQELQQVQQENAALRDRLAQVELDLVQQQIEWQLESVSTHSHTHAAVEINKAVGAIEPPSFEPTTDPVNQLLQELERSQQTAQRQQILVETLTEQLESSQARIAQLERDCALTQQRYNEQVQQVLQAEGACRDLRLRLHRQQQQTLQFKAALEKCLEMPTTYGQAVMPDVAIDDSAETADALSALLKPKNQPVKPWSLPPRAMDALESEQSALPEPLFRLLSGLSAQGDDINELPDDAVTGFSMPFSREDQEISLSTAADPSALIDTDDPEFTTRLMELIFPNPVEQSIYTTTDALQAEPILDLSPLETEVAATPIGEVSSQAQSISLARSTDRTVALPTSIGAKEMPIDAGMTQMTAMSDISLSTPLAADATNPSADDCRDVLQAASVPLPTIEKTQAETSVDVEAAVEVEAVEAEAIKAEAVEAEAVEAEALEAKVFSRSDALAASKSDLVLDATSLMPTELRSAQAALPGDITLSVAASAEGSAPLKSTTASDTTSTRQPIAAWTWRDRLANASQIPRLALSEAMPENVTSENVTPEKAAQSPANLLALSSLSRQSGNQSGKHSAASQQPAHVTSQAEPASTPFSTVAPSPIVYPLRSTKKLASLAAVDLPTFPKR